MLLQCLIFWVKFILIKYCRVKSWKLIYVLSLDIKFVRNSHDICVESLNSAIFFLLLPFLVHLFLIISYKDELMYYWFATPRQIMWNVQKYGRFSIWRTTQVIFIVKNGDLFDEVRSFGPQYMLVLYISIYLYLKCTNDS